VTAEERTLEERKETANAAQTERKKNVERREKRQKNHEEQ